MKVGRWTFDPDAFVAYHEADPSYEVDLEDCTDSAHILDWLCQLQGKGWVNNEDVGDLLQVIGLVLGGLQSCVCSSGRNGHVNPRERFELHSHLDLNRVKGVVDSTN